MNNTTVDVSNDDVQCHFHHHHLSNLLDSTPQINHKMSASNDELLFNAAKSGDLKKVKELLSKGTGTGYRDGVS